MGNSVYLVNIYIVKKTNSALPTISYGNKANFAG